MHITQELVTSANIKHKRNPWLTQFRSTVVSGLASTEHRHYSGDVVVKDEFVLKCTLMDPTVFNLDWSTMTTAAGELEVNEFSCVAKIAQETIAKLREELIDEACDMGW